MNEFLNHQIAHNKLFLEVKNVGCEFVYSKFTEDYEARILLRPSTKELFLYGIDNGIIIFRYARRRNRADIIYHFLKEETDVEVLVEV